MKTRFLPAPRRLKTKAFTLLELLAAAAVLALLVLMLSQIVSSVSNAVGRNRKKLESSDYARQALDRMSLDFAARIVRPDLPADFAKLAGSDSFRFYSEVNGYDGKRQAALLGYRIQEGAGDRIHQLERGATGTDWEGSAVLPLASPVLPDPVDADYEVLSDGIFRLEICYQKKADGKLTNVLPADPNEIGAVIVAVATLDPASRSILNEGQFLKLVQALPDNTEGEEPAQAWQKKLALPDFAPDLPPNVVQSINVFQRYFPLP